MNPYSDRILKYKLLSDDKKYLDLDTREHLIFLKIPPKILIYRLPI